ncbi:arabinan endo-1,5-alpha-L-arabinosidase [Zunongwangia sp. HGR-M22]|uniref:arabinan endo-1,5-alpha-L-arabinosidase n=1 Tax=Zunongwangia sp. HGR-M22 TaxID=3015168 RepID=UPI0022DDD6CA|nr:arabinan endo-1,5-alpha-L-arabinosidase [Zunongwangia sp. HGR-M22]WBL24159.1 arabinan endo-1,5-alpha-L-arabinosidase [Zunongwangia sp. HGR-M22]
MKNLRYCLLGLLLNGFLASAQMITPTNETMVHDPVAIKAEGKYYMFCTGRGISMFSSEDLKEWKHEAPVFEEKPSWTDGVVPEFRNHIWAPDIVEHEGKFYLYYSVSAFAKNTSAIGLTINSTLDPNSPNYKWEDQGIIVQSVPNRDMWNAIDPNIVFDEEGTAWLNFGSFWDGLKLVKLSKDLKSVAQPEEWYTIARRERSFDIPDKNPGDAALEAPFIFKKDGWYYLFISWDLCCRGEDSTYKVVVGRSKSVKGPYLDQSGKSLANGGGTLVVEGNENWYGAGHNSVYTFDGKDYMFFHAYDAQDGAKPKLRIKELSWENDWPEQLKLN